MSIVVCPKCGARNRIPVDTDSERMYRCSKCGTRLSLVPKIRDVKHEEKTVIRSPEKVKQKDIYISKSGISYFSLRRVVAWFKIRENQLIFSMVLLALLLHLFVVPYVNMAVFDEHYYLPEARSIIHREALTVPQHPSLGKLFIVAGILTFGDNPWGWRMPSVVFGVASLLLFYFICRRLANKEVALLACFLLLFESLTFVMSNIAMLDVFSLTFMLLAFLFYLKDRYVFSGMSLALSAVCKLTGFLGIFVILTHWLIRKRRKPLRNVALFLFVVLVGFMVLLPTTDFLATGHWTSPTYSLSQQLETNRILTFAILSPEDREMASYPWTWVLKYTGTRFTYQKDFVWAINPAVWILIIPSMGYMLYEFIRRRTDVSLFVLLWFGATYLPWILLVILTDRQTYVYHFYPAVGAICIGISLAGARIWSFASRMSSSLCGGLIKAAAIGYLVVDVLFFLSLTPIMADITSHL